MADRPLTAVLLPRPDAARAIADRWDRDETVAVLDPDAPRAAAERVLAVRDVCIAGAPDDEWGERVVAFVVADDPGAPPTLDDLRGFAGDQLSRPQLPKQVVVVDAIPHTPGGKVLRRSLRMPAR